MEADDVSGYDDFETAMNAVTLALNSRNQLIPIPDEFRNMVGLTVEKVRIVLYDANLKILASEIIGTGTDNNVQWDPERLSELARTTPDARYATFGHNHPMSDEIMAMARKAGVTHPDVILPYTVSDQDFWSTFNARYRFAEYGIELRDHVVVGEKVAVSIRRMFANVNRTWFNLAPGFAFDPSQKLFDYSPFSPAYA